jgi:hypothetical protein
MDTFDKEKTTLYNKIFDTKLVLRDAQEHFLGYSANDIKKLVNSGMTAKRGTPAGLKLLYELEQQIADLRLEFIMVRDKMKEAVEAEAVGAETAGAETAPPTVRRQNR